MVVIVIIGITMTLGVQFMPWLLAESQLTSTGRELASFVTDMRDDAVVYGQTVRIEYQLGDRDGDAQYYRALRESDPGREDDLEEDEGYLTLRDWVRLPYEVRLEAIVLGPNDEILQGFFSVLAQPDGSITPHGLRLYNAELDAWGTVRVNGLLGEAKFKIGDYVPGVISAEAF